MTDLVATAEVGWQRLTDRGSPAVLSVRGATKRFGAVLALDHVDLEVRAGEVLALLGDNGAGKSTLIKCLSGVHRLDEGVIELDGRPVDMRSPADARAHGSRRSTRTWRCSTTLTRRPTSTPDASWPVLAGCRAACASCARARWPRRLARSWPACRSGCPTRRASVGLMSGGQRQAVAVARAAAFSSRVVILDEPTAALGVREIAPGARPCGAPARRRATP